MAEAKPAATAKPKRGMLSWIVLIAVLLLVPVAGWFGLDYYKKKSHPKSPASKDPAAKAAGESHGKKEKAPPSRMPARMPIPLAGPQMAMVPGNPAKKILPSMVVTNHPLVFLPGDPRHDVPSRIVTTNAFKANRLRTEQITIRFADTKRPHHAVTQLFLVGENTEALLRAMNDHQLVLFESVTNMLSSKYYKDTKIPGFRNMLRTEVLALANKTFGSNLVQEVLIPEFITQ